MPWSCRTWPGISMAHAASSRCWPVPPVMPASGTGGPTHVTASPVQLAQSLGTGLFQASPLGRRRLEALAPVGACPGPAQLCWGIPGPSRGGAGASGHCGAPRDFPEPSNAQPPQTSTPAPNSCLQGVLGAEGQGEQDAGDGTCPTGWECSGCSLPSAAVGDAAPAPHEFVGRGALGCVGVVGSALLGWWFWSAELCHHLSMCILERDRNKAKGPFFSHLCFNDLMEAMYFWAVANHWRTCDSVFHGRSQNENFSLPTSSLSGNSRPKI